MLRKLFLASAICLVSVASQAYLDCNYTTEQEIVRSAENVSEIRKLGKDVDFNKVYSCGGTLSQLAVLRGNIDLIDYLWLHDADFNVNVPTAGYDIKGAPDTIPFPLFVARFAPNSMIVDSMLRNGVNFKVKDSLGQGADYYFDQNPVLRHTYLTKQGDKSLRSTTDLVNEIRGE